MYNTGRPYKAPYLVLGDLHSTEAPQNRYAVPIAPPGARVAMPGRTFQNILWCRDAPSLQELSQDKKSLHVTYSSTQDLPACNLSAVQYDYSLSPRLPPAAPCCPLW